MLQVLQYNVRVASSLFARYMGAPVVGGHVCRLGGNTVAIQENRSLLPV